jgi:hypothetical protein
MLFKDKSLYELYRKDGYVVLPLFDDNYLGALKELYQKNTIGQEKGLLPSLRYRSNDEKVTEYNDIAAIVDTALRRYFEDFDYVANHFITKTANNPDEFRLHQDWNVTDEDKYIAAHIWSPLQDTDEQNGGLFVVKGSHNFFKNFRSGSLGIPFITTTESVKQHITSFKLKQGEAIVYNQALFHGSHPNNTDTDRKVVLSCIKPKEAPMLIYHKEGADSSGTRIKAYKITPNMLLEQIAELEKGAVPEQAALYSEFTVSNSQQKEINNHSFEEHLR